MKQFACALCIALIAPMVSAQAVSLDTVGQREAEEHTRIRAMRASEEAKATAAEAACYQRFAVNDCLIEVHARKRELLADLRRQEVSLNDVARKRRAAEALLRSDDRAAGAPTP